MPTAPPDYIPDPLQFDQSSFMTLAPIKLSVFTPSAPPNLYQNVHDAHMQLQMEGGFNIDLNAFFF